MSNDPVKITVTIEVPPSLVLEMQKNAFQSQIDGTLQVQEGLMNAWTGLWAQAAGTAQQSFLQMFQIPSSKALTERKK